MVFCVLTSWLQFFIDQEGKLLVNNKQLSYLILFYSILFYSNLFYSGQSRPQPAAGEEMGLLS